MRRKKLYVFGIVLMAFTAFSFVTLRQAADTDANNLVKTYLASCQEEVCLGSQLKKLTASHGPKKAVAALQEYEKNYSSSSKSDYHDLAHIIGRQTAQTFGIHGQAFLDCSTEYNYGCQHGFFEKALANSDSPKEAIDQICGTFEKSSKYTQKFKFYCYHGVGHGVMMSQAYDLQAALGICDGLSSFMAQDGCWQGVFMENVNAAGRGEARKNVFSSNDPLAPCNKIADKYQLECYINHAGYLMAFFGSSVKKSSAACLMAPSPQARTCLESIGLMVSNRGWQQGLLPSGHSNQSLESRAWQLCQVFPSGHMAPCVTGAVDQILNFDQLNITSAVRFCQLVSDKYQAGCYQRMGSSIVAQSLTPQQAKNKCTEISNTVGRNACISGVGFIN